MLRNSGRVPLTELDETEVEDILISDMIADVALCKALLDSIDFEENREEQARLYEQTRKISIL